MHGRGGDQVSEVAKLGTKRRGRGRDGTRVSARVCVVDRVRVRVTVRGAQISEVARVGVELGGTPVATELDEAVSMRACE